LLRLERIDVVNGVLFTCCDVYATTVIGRETSLLRSTLAGVLDGCENLDVGKVFVDESLLGDVVESSGGEDAPVEIARCFMGVRLRY
jgi:predicted ABC-type transport system involved in lysophospholipase L1 biosynthesis ATPase subunit